MISHIYEFLETKGVYVASVLCFFPFLYLAIYNQPSADDFCFCKVEEFGFWGAQKEWYFNWTGRYFYILLMSIIHILNPGFWLQKIYPILVLIGLSISIYALFNSLGYRSLHLKKKWVLTLLILLTYVYASPNIPELLYWISGSLNYVLAIIEVVVLFLIVTRYFDSGKNNKNEWVYFLVGGGVCICAIGTSELNIVTINFFLLVKLLLDLYYKKQADKFIAFLLTISILCSLAVFFAPGNTVRNSFFEHSGEITTSVLNGLGGAVRNAYYRLVDSPLLIFSIAYIPFGARLSHQRTQMKDLYLKLPFLILLMAFLIPMILYIGASYWSMGQSLPARAHNYITFYFIIGWFILLQIAIDRYLPEHTGIRHGLPLYSKVMVMLALAFYLVRDNNYVTAYGDIINGTGVSYASESESRLEKLKNNREAIVEVELLRNRPETLFFDDFGTSDSHWMNVCVAKYYKKQSVRGVHHSGN